MPLHILDSASPPLPWALRSLACQSIYDGALFFLAASVSEHMAAQPLRLTINGSTILQPSGDPIRLVGFNWQFGRTSPDAGSLSKSLAPQANLARLVGVLWGNTDPLQHHPNKECMTNTPPHYFNDKCFHDLDPFVKSATDAGLWVVLALRGEYIAGQNFDTDPGSVVFRNETLQKMMFAMWKHVAGHYASFDRIAAYELLSEPRDKEVNASAVRQVYEGACSAVGAADPRTPCLVGGAPYYKLWTFGDETILRNTANRVIYTYRRRRSNPRPSHRAQLTCCVRSIIGSFDYFNPDDFVFGRSGAAAAAATPPLAPLVRSLPIPKYGSGQKYACRALYDGWETQACPSWNVSDPEALLPFDRQWHEHNLRAFALPARTKHRVPLLINQFEVVHGVTEGNGRYTYIQDLLSLAKELDLGWAWWTWAGGNSEGWSHGSSEIVFRWPNGSYMVDRPVLAAMEPYW